METAALINTTSDPQTLYRDMRKIGEGAGGTVYLGMEASSGESWLATGVARDDDHDAAETPVQSRWTQGGLLVGLRDLFHPWQRFTLHRLICSLLSTLPGRQASRDQGRPHE